MIDIEVKSDKKNNFKVPVQLAKTPEKITYDRGCLAE